LNRNYKCNLHSAGKGKKSIAIQTL
jgi:hypothetical protein